MAKRRLVVEVDAARATCGECRHIADGYGYADCRLFLDADERWTERWTPLQFTGTNSRPDRCPQCLEAERKAGTG